MEIGCEVADDSEVRVCGTICVMTTLEFLQHFLAKLGHGDLLFSVTQLISTVSLSPSAEVQTRGSVRRERLRPNRDSTLLPSGKTFSSGLKSAMACLRQSLSQTFLRRLVISGSDLRSRPADTACLDS